jgi:hypothetical protein
MTANIPAKLLEAAIAFDELRVEALRLRRERNASVCDGLDPTFPNVYPCWRGQQQQSTPDDSWCEPCLENRRLHRELVVVRERRGYALKRFSRWRQRYQELQVPLPLDERTREAALADLARVLDDDKLGYDSLIGAACAVREAFE